ncbi:MAG: hypothetical protein AB2993_07505 (plasmid) [Candidatus Symbiodolus clandestinus]
MSIEKKPKLKKGRVYRVVKLPVGLHEDLKTVAAREAKKIFHLYEEIINNFLIEASESDKKVNYLFHRGEIKDITISLTRELSDAVKVVSKADTVPETRIMFTAIMQFAEKNGLIN